MLCYLATPFSHPDWHVRHNRWSVACAICARLLKSGVKVISPIAASYHVAIAGEMESDYQTWKDLDRLLLSKCDMLLVAAMPGWQDSVGVRDEIEFAKESGIPITMLPDGFLDSLDNVSEIAKMIIEG